MSKKVYLIRAAQFYKIGISGTPKRRLKSIQTGCPIECEYIGYFPTDNPEQLEKDLHLEFQDFNTYGEWFDLGDDNVRLLITDYNLKHITNPFSDTTSLSDIATSSKALKSARGLSAGVNEVDILYQQYYPGKVLSVHGKSGVRKLITSYGVETVSECLKHLSVKMGCEEVFKHLKNACKTYDNYGRHISDKMWFMYWRLKKNMHQSDVTEVLHWFMENRHDSNIELIDHVVEHASNGFAIYIGVWDCIDEYLDYLDSNK